MAERNLTAHEWLDAMSQEERADLLRRWRIYCSDNDNRQASLTVQEANFLLELLEEDK